MSDTKEWYTADEMYNWLRRNNYSEAIAAEISKDYAKNLQLAYEKGATHTGNRIQLTSLDDRKPPEYERVLVYNLDVVMQCWGTAVYIGGKFLFDATLINKHTSFEAVSDQPIKITHWFSLTAFQVPQVADTSEANEP